ncbi:YbaY family lipoprotein [Agrococcus jejuensis]|uniref:Type III secretion system lipoprotein chaperone (YscW) n=1 Tax=Agrococcus jejuensis TaxID=399736 RepID=A0A1G8E1X7_9MICO|nr:YbaY family lipoprotein [Agrococcus jejuensis]SDH63865.1 Type III secretion system lipoprotein chaperone (YscW) [Agrococcus jejuensis]
MSVLQVTGEAWMRERMLLPPDAILTVELLDGDAVVAATAIEGSPPTRFALAVDEARVTDADQLRVRATLRTDAGTWASPEPVADWERVLLVRDASDEPADDDGSV